MILNPGEKIHVVHRRSFEKDIRRHFVGVVEAYEGGVLRANGYVYVIEDSKQNLFQRKPESRTRIFSLVAGNVFINVLPESVNLDKVVYEYHDKALRVTDGSQWHLDVKEFSFGWG